MRHEAIYNTHSNVTSIDDGLGAFDKDGNSVTIDETKVAEEIKKLQAEYDALQYQRDRATSYPSIQDQLDMQYHDTVNGTTTWKDAIAKVKTDNPKPSE
tara:strand:+ start:1137 stop:1433 length:297 start_codon:yes stop_codon:yes gene_type:complete